MFKEIKLENGLMTLNDGQIFSLKIENHIYIRKTNSKYYDCAFVIIIYNNYLWANYAVLII